MSADRWSICPKCLQKHDDALEAAYGKVSPTVYAGMCSQELDTNMREDWELGTDEEGKFSINYSCYCRSCGFKFEHKHEEQVPLK